MPCYCWSSRPCASQDNCVVLLWQRQVAALLRHLLCPWRRLLVHLLLLLLAQASLAAAQGSNSVRQLLRSQAVLSSTAAYPNNRGTSPARLLLSVGR
jgi:hypothetical protein